jgi:HEAT repeat protein
MKQRGKFTAFSAMLLAAGLIIVAAYQLRNQILAQFYLGRIDSEDPALRKGAIENLGELRSGRAASRLILLALEKDPLQAEAIEALRKIGPGIPSRALEPLATGLSSETTAVWKQAFKVLERLGPAGTPALLDLLGSPHWRVRYCAAILLGRKGLDPDRVVPALAAALEDENYLIRLQAALSLRQIGPGAREAIPALRRAMERKGKWRGLRFTGRRAIARLDGSDPKFLLSLLEKYRGQL